ncbi:MAG TPA: hypothetical protein VN764_16415, partial [Polyangiaceae bacterium]|nr:hypothetical protein [Polyangiaceae bacterium]
TSDSEDIEGLFAREKSVPAPRTAASPDGSWHASFPSESEVELVQGEGHTQAAFSLGTEAKTRCFFYQEPVDAGQAIQAILNNMAETVQFKDLVAYRVTVAQRTPVVFVEGLYVVESTDGKKMGGLKLAVSPRHQVPVFCFLDEPGYKETFVSAVANVLSTLEVKEPQKELPYAEIWEASIDGKPLGFQWLYKLEPGQGKQTSISLSAMFVPTAPGALAISDELEMFDSDAGGIVAGTFFKSEGGRVIYDLEMSRSARSKFKVRGKTLDKDFETEFTAPRLSDDIAFYRFLLKGKDTKLEASEYTPSFDPTKVNQVTYLLDKAARSVKVQVNDISLVGSLDESGLPAELSTKAGSGEFKQKIIYRAGTP